MPTRHSKKSRWTGAAKKVPLSALNMGCGPRTVEGDKTIGDIRTGEKAGKKGHHEPTVVFEDNERGTRLGGGDVIQAQRKESGMPGALITVHQLTRDLEKGHKS